MEIGITGPRSITYDQETRLRRHIVKIPHHNDVTWHIGDARGVDQTARDWAAQHQIDTTIYMTTSHRHWLFLQRSKELVNEIAFANGELYAFPNRLCPTDLTPKQCKYWHGSGTWGTIAYAISQSITVHIQPLTPISLPNWYEQSTLQSSPVI
jgi:hypothetical protein